MGLASVVNDMPKVLIVEDDQAMATALSDGFHFEGYDVLVANDGMSGLQLAQQKQIDVLLLDVMLPKMSGVDVCKQLRKSGNDVPVIMLTARGQEIDKVLGLRMGADDYVTKPFSFMELVARVEALLRRTSKASESLEEFTFGNVRVNFRTCEAWKNEAPVELSSRELKLLEFFIEKRGQVVTRDHLLEVVWGYDNPTITRTVDTHVARLRQKIEDTPGDPKHLITIHRVGYKFIA